MDTDGHSLFVGGEFRNIGGQPRSLVGAVDLRTGGVTGWNPGVTGPSDRYIVGPYVSEVLYHRGAVYVGGQFKSVSGQPRSALAAVDASTGALLPWDPNPTYDYPYPYPYVWALAAAGDTVYVGGSFDAIGGRAQPFLAAIDPGTGLATGWNPRPSQQVFELAVDDSTVYVGGSYRTLGDWTIRHQLAAFDLTTGEVKDWNPDPNGNTCNALAAKDGVVYVGGDFSAIGGQTRVGFAALDTLTGAALPWSANSDDAVNQIVADGHDVFVAGEFTSIGGVARRGIAQLDAATGQVTPWDAQTNGPVVDVALDDSTVYMAGWFSRLGLEPHRYLGAVDRRTGGVLPWRAEPNTWVNALCVGPQAIYAGGAFDSINGQPRQCLAALDRTTGDVLPWDPHLAGAVAANFPDVYTLATHGGAVYAGGDFYLLGGERRPCLGAVDDSVGVPTDWTPGADFVVVDVSISGDVLYAGGSFGSIGLLPNSGLAALSLPIQPEPPPPPPSRVTLTASTPNPASTVALIRFALPRAQEVTLSLFDAQGRRLQCLLDHHLLPPGGQQVQLDASRWRPGIYFYRLETGGQSLSHKLVIAR